MTKVFALALLLAGGSLARPGFGLLFHCGLVPAEVVLAHPQTHAERNVHGACPGHQGSDHG
jgi:hypothetical protein